VTEAEWLAANQPWPMLEFLYARGGTSERKSRLFAAACCRRIWHLLTDRRSREAVEVAELYADRLLGLQELQAADAAASQATSGPYEATPRGQNGAHLHARMAAWWTVASPCDPEESANRAYSATVCDPGDPEEEEPAQAALLRDLTGNPFRLPPLLNPAWLAWNGGVAWRLAETAYRERQMPTGTLDPARLALLADALEDAGCTDAELLGHLRGPGPHWRGCRALDCVLGKS
jgi:hypothetical protein